MESLCTGRLLMRRYGKFIDNHEMVLRFNIPNFEKYAQIVGKKTTIKVLNHRRGVQTCLESHVNQNLLKNTKALMFWHPWEVQKIMRKCKER